MKYKYENWKSVVKTEIQDTTMERILIENESLRENLNKLRRGYNVLIFEISLMRKENENFKIKLKEEKDLCESLHDEIKTLRERLNNDKYDSSETKSTENILLLEQLDTYREDFQIERKRYGKLKKQNTELITELEESKRTLEKQQKKLLLYANLFQHPIKSKLTLDCSKNNKNQYRKTIEGPEIILKDLSHEKNKQCLMDKRYRSKSSDTYESKTSSNRNEQIKRTRSSNYLTSIHTEDTKSSTFYRDYVQIPSSCSISSNSTNSNLLTMDRYNIYENIPNEQLPKKDDIVSEYLIAIDPDQTIDGWNVNEF